MAEADLLRSLAATTEAGCIVELGSFRGKSATAFAFGLLANNRPEVPKIFCIEPHAPFTGFYGGRFGPEDRGAFFEVMLRTGFYRFVSLVNLPSAVVAPNWHEPIGLLFIDGDHFYESVRRDFLIWSQHVLPEGVIAFDDATDLSCGPHRVITEMMPRDEYSEIARCGKIIAFRKL